MAHGGLQRGNASSACVHSLRVALKRVTLRSIHAARLTHALADNDRFQRLA